MEKIKTIKSNERIFLKLNKIIYRINFLNILKYDMINLKKISILTSNQGPIVDDVAMALFFEFAILVIPSQHQNYNNLFNKISEIFNIDYQKVIDAMTCTENAEFILWNKQ